MIQPLESRRLLAAIAPGVTETGGSDKIFTLPLVAGTDVIIATHVTNDFDKLDVSLVNPSTGYSVGYMINGTGYGHTGAFQVPASGTYELRLDITQLDPNEFGHAIPGDWFTTVFTRTSAQRADDTNRTPIDGKVYAGNLPSSSDVDWWTTTQSAKSFTSAAFGPTGGSTLGGFNLVHVTPDGFVTSGATVDADDTFWASDRPDDPNAIGTHYYLIAGSAGGYAVSFATLPDARDASVDEHATPLSGKTYAGTIIAGDQDVFPIFVKKGASITASLSPASGSSFKPSLRIVDANGKALSTVTGTGTISTHADAATKNTMLFLLVRGAGFTTGGYSLKYDLTAGTGVGPIDELGQLNLTGSASADVFRFSAPDAATLRATVNGKSTDYDVNAVRGLHIDAGDGNDRIDFQDLTLHGYVSAGSGNDTVIGGSGNDSFTGGAGKNQLVGNDGDDRLKGSNGPDLLLGGGGEDRLYGGAGDDRLEGGSGTDRLWGEAGNDVLIGNAGNDKLYGGDGKDTLSGNAGDDRFDGGSATDTVLDKQKGDTLVNIENA